jgi:nitrite reductase/ring-hydroxylating ferredoxin subunit
VEVNEIPVVLVRRGKDVFALAETCAHLGGPLSGGALEGDSIICPWHGSRFDLRSGAILNGPSTHPQTCLQTRVRSGQVEVRASPDDAG